jgi:hypothetical protein
VTRTFALLVPHVLRYLRKSSRSCLSGLVRWRTSAAASDISDSNIEGRT